MISIKKVDITQLDTDAIVNAANDGLWAGGGVCGAIFRAAGYDALTKACEEIGGCQTGSAVITPGFNLKAKNIIHAVGPRWQGGNNNEQADLYHCYMKSLELAFENDIHSIAFPLISSGIFGYPKEDAWEVAITACKDFTEACPSYELDIVFAVLDDGILEMGQKILNRNITKND